MQAMPGDADARCRLIWMNGEAMNLKVEWVEGKPEEFQPGMLVETMLGSVLMIGEILRDGGYEPSIRLDLKEIVIRWAWLIKPHELFWIEDMAKQHRKGKTE